MICIHYIFIGLSLILVSIFPSISQAAECFGNGITCGEPVQVLPAYLRAVETYKIGSNTYLFGADSTSNGAASTAEYIYKWQSAQECFGNGTTCGAVYQDMSTGNTIRKLKPFSVGSNVYLLAMPNLYKWQSSQQCFGNGTTCGGVLSTFSFNQPSWDVDTVTFNGATYVTDGLSVYKFQPAQECLGNGTTCKQVLQALPYYWYMGGVTFSHIGSNLFLTRAPLYTFETTPGVYKWQSSQQCFGNGITCGMAIQSINQAYVYNLRSLNVDEGDYTMWTGNGYLLKWLPTQSCFGSGTTCGNVYQQISTDQFPYDSREFSRDGDRYLVIGSVYNLKLYKWREAEQCFGNTTQCSGVLDSISYQSNSVTTFADSSKEYVVFSNLNGNNVSLFVFRVHDPSPTCSIALSPNPINNGDSATLSWDSSNADYLYIQNVGYVNTSGSTTVTPSSTTDYNGSAYSSGGSSNCNGEPILTVYPSCDFNGTSIQNNQSVTAYQTGSVPYGATCKSEIRSCSQGALSGSYVYPSCTVNETPPPPTATVSVLPTRVYREGTANVVWSSEGADSCTVTGGGDSWTGLASPEGGETTSSVKGEVTYTLHCVNTGGEVYASSTVNTLPTIQET